MTAVQRTYYQDTYLMALDTTLQAHGEDERGFYLIPAATIFHPQGGGQPDDVGTLHIEGHDYLVTELQEEGKVIKHYVPELDPASAPAIGTPLHMEVDSLQRMVYAQYHTAGHLLAASIEQAYPELVGVKGTHFPGVANLMFKLRHKATETPIQEDFATLDLEELAKEAAARIDRAREADHAVTLQEVNGKRTVAIGSRPAVPCGGTHLRRLGELAPLTLTKVAFKKREGLKVSYTMELASS